ncbi:MAG: ThuA domain-containing protein, partial [Woeseiaceae bacterium]
MRSLYSLIAALVLGSPPAAAGEPAVLVFSKTAGYRHVSIEDGVAMLRDLGREQGFAVEHSEDAGLFSDDSLPRFAAVVFLSTTGDVLDAGQQRSFERYIRNGGAYLGIHAAADTEYDWPWYVGLVGAWFDGHPEIQAADVVVEDPRH